MSHLHMFSAEAPGLDVCECGAIQRNPHTEDPVTVSDCRSCGIRPGRWRAGGLTPDGPVCGDCLQAAVSRGVPA